MTTIRKVKTFTLAILMLISASLAQATPRFWGIDQLGGAKYRNEIINGHPDGFALGIFTQKDLFGDAYPVVDAALARRRIPLVRYNLRWSDSHTFTTRDFPKIVAEARRFVPLVVKYPNVECEMSGATEHQLNARDASELARQVLNVIPDRCKYVNNPWEGRGAFIPPTDRIKNEVHGDKAQRPRVGGKYNFSFDGTDAFDVDTTKLKNRLSDADVFFFWTAQNNGRRNAGDPTPRPQRKYWPTVNLMRMMQYLSTEEGPQSLPRNWLLKSKADQHNVPPEPRALKPVFIVPRGVQSLELRGPQGVFRASQPQPFADGRVRFYMPKFGYEMGTSLEIIANRRKVGVCNPGFRAGSFR